jgi:hypothetical protein
MFPGSLHYETGTRFATKTIFIWSVWTIVNCVIICSFISEFLLQACMNGLDVVFCEVAPSNPRLVRDYDDFEILVDKLSQPLGNSRKKLNFLRIFTVPFVMD